MPDAPAKARPTAASRLISDVHVQQGGRSGGPRRAGVDDGGGHVEQRVEHEQRHGERTEVLGEREHHEGPDDSEREADEVQPPQGGRRRRDAGAQRWWWSWILSVALTKAAASGRRDRKHRAGERTFCRRQLWRLRVKLSRRNVLSASERATGCCVLQSTLDAVEQERDRISGDRAGGLHHRGQGRPTKRWPCRCRRTR